jgi:mannosyl-3-phosphoglycerate phosphatase
MYDSLVIFTDLDGTLLDADTYSYESSLPAIRMVKEKGIPLVFCSSRTRAEQEALRSDLSVKDPFIVEDGAALYVPIDYFPFEYECSFQTENYRVAEFATPYADVREALLAVNAETGAKLIGYGDLSVDEVASVTGLQKDAAERAKLRDYQETIVSGIDADNMEQVTLAFGKLGLSLTRGGKFFSVGSSKGKGMAAQMLIGLMSTEEPELRAAGIGDSQNDVSLLDLVDLPFLVQKPGGAWEAMQVPDLVRVPHVGPEGWASAVTALLEN